MAHGIGLLSKRISVIDLGSNSIKLVNYELTDEGPGPVYSSYRQEGIKVKIGKGLTYSGRLSKASITRTIEALKLYRDIVALDQIETVFPVATSAVREAENRNDFLDQVYNQTGYRFKALSGEDEALYSFVGASRSIDMTDALFFDIGGGSLEIVYVENRRIRKVKSYPLGALRLSEFFGDRKNGAFSKKAYNQMEEHVLSVLPSERQMDLSPDTQLVGVGGSLRAIARLDQEMSGYELSKVHKYRMNCESVATIARKLAKAEIGELSRLPAIGANRADTIAAGSLVVSLLMRKFSLNHVTVSTHGLREGVLSIHMNDPRTFYGSSIIDIETLQQLAWPRRIVENSISEDISALVGPLVALGFFREKEKTILAHAMAMTQNIGSGTRFTNLSNLFFVLVDNDNAFLSHREQLIMALSIIHAKKEKAADWLFSRHPSILDPSNKKSVEKISAILALSEILEKMEARAELYACEGKDLQKLNLRIILKMNRQPGGDECVNIPSFMIAHSLRNFERAFGISVAGCHVSFLDDFRKQDGMVIDIGALNNEGINPAEIRVDKASWS